MTWAQRAVLAVLVPVVVIGGLFVGRELGDAGRSDGVQIAGVEADAHFAHDYVIPRGTAARIASGESVEIVPRELVVRVGEAIRIVNDDVDGHVVGVFYVGAGETLTQQFTAPGDLSGQCSVHPSGEFTLRVEA